MFDLTLTRYLNMPLIYHYRTFLLFLFIINYHLQKSFNRYTIDYNDKFCLIA